VTRYITTSFGRSSDVMRASRDLSQTFVTSSHGPTNFMDMTAKSFLLKWTETVNEMIRKFMFVSSVMCKIEMKVFANCNLKESFVCVQRFFQILPRYMATKILLL